MTEFSDIDILLAVFLEVGLILRVTVYSETAIISFHLAGIVYIKRAIVNVKLPKVALYYLIC